MKIELKTMDANSETDYSILLDNSHNSMFNHSIEYRNFLRCILPDAKEHYILAYGAGELLGALPIFSKNGPMGTVVNSLPFYGSHGSVVSRHEASVDVYAVLLDAFQLYCHEIDAAFSTLIQSPYEKFDIAYQKLNSDITESRICQITQFPKFDSANIEDRLMSLFHQKTRNMVKKSFKSKFNIQSSQSVEIIDELHRIHDENMRIINGIAKPLSVFKAISKCFIPTTDYKIYYATKDGDVAAALLVFFYKDMVEYFTPAINSKYRSEQPLSLLIFTAMKDAIEQHSVRRWNWGGTWLSQHGVYRFKSRWGAQDHTYNYYTNIYNKHIDISKISKNDLLEHYPFFYTLPFDLLERP